MGTCESNQKNQDNPKEGRTMKDTPLSKLEPSIDGISKSLCMIGIQNSNYTGFLIQLLKDGQEFFCLITNGHIITDEMLNRGDTIRFYYDINNRKNKTIYLKKDERYIKNFNDIKIDIIVIQILPEDNIEKEYFLFPDTNYMNNYNELKNKDIITLYYSGNNVYHFDGKITDIKNNNEFIYSASLTGCSGNSDFRAERSCL